VHKKRLHILFDPDIKAFQGWEAVLESWSLATCEKFIKSCHIGKVFPPSHHGINRKYNVANLKYCTWPKFKKRCTQVHQASVEDFVYYKHALITQNPVGKGFMGACTRKALKDFLNKERIF
jgi:hypothetical protein